METIGQRITNARIRLNMNQKELCKKAGLTESSLSRFENDLREPRSSALIKLADALEVSFDYLMGVTDIMDIEPPIVTNVENDIKNILENTEALLSQDGLMFYGKPVTKDDVDRLLTAIRVGASLMDK